MCNALHIYSTIIYILFKKKYISFIFFGKNPVRIYCTIYFMVQYNSSRNRSTTFSLQFYEGEKII